jgi:hypothetical protein
MGRGELRYCDGVAFPSLTTGARSIQQQHNHIADVNWFCNYWQFAVEWNVQCYYRI